MGEHGGAYQRINQELQLAKFPGREALIVCRGFELLFQDCPELRPETRSIFRGMNSITDDQFASFHPGKTFYWPSYVSCSSEREQAEKFARPDPDKESPVDRKSVLFQIRLKKGAMALDLESISDFPE